MCATRKGKTLEKLVTVIEKALAGMNCKIESPKKLRDKDNNELREHDVVITATNGHHETLIAIECRDRSRPVGTPAIEAFVSKCSHTGVNQGVIVSSSGFYKTALVKACSFAIECININEANTFDWLATQVFNLTKLHNQHFNFITEEPINTQNFAILKQQGNQLTLEELSKELIEHV